MSIFGYYRVRLSEEIYLLPPNIAFTSKRNFSQNIRIYNSLTKLDFRNIYTDKERISLKQTSKTKN